MQLYLVDMASGQLDVSKLLKTREIRMDWVLTCRCVGGKVGLSQMRREIKALIEAAKNQRRKDMMQAKTPAGITSICPVAPQTRDLAQETTWHTFPDLVQRYGLSHTKISKDFVGRDGVIKCGSDYRVSDTALREWLAEAAASAKIKRVR